MFNKLETLEVVGKTVILITDGEDFLTDTWHMLPKIKKENLTVITLGIGTPNGAPIPIITQDGSIGDYLKDKKNNIVITKLNENLLNDLAQNTGGIYLRAQEDHRDIQQITKFLKKIEKKRKMADSQIMIEEKYHLPLFLSLCFLLLSWIL